LYNTGTVSKASYACCTQAVPAHAAGHVERAWTVKSTPVVKLSFLTCTTVARRDQSPVTGTVTQATMTNGIDRLPCSCLYRSLATE